MKTIILKYFFVLILTSGHRVKLAGRKSAFKPPGGLFY